MIRGRPDPAENEHAGQKFRSWLEERRARKAHLDLSQVEQKRDLEQVDEVTLVVQGVRRARFTLMDRLEPQEEEVMPHRSHALLPPLAPIPMAFRDKQYRVSNPR